MVSQGVAKAGVAAKAAVAGAKQAIARGIAKATKPSGSPNPTPNPSPPAAKPTPSPSPAPSSSTGELSPWLIFSIPLINYILHMVYGFQINFVIILVEALTFWFFLYIANINWKFLLVPLSLQLIIPGVLIFVSPESVLALTSFSVVLNVLLLVPWWFILIAIHESKANPKIMIGALVVLIFFFAPTAISAITSVDKYIVNQDLIIETGTALKRATGERLTYWKTEGQILICATNPQTTTKQCESKYRPEDEQFVASIKIAELEELSSFTMDVPSRRFVDPGLLYTDVISSPITAKSNLDQDPTIRFACGLRNRGGKAKPASLVVPKGIEFDETVDCTVDILNAANLDFYFNATAEKVISVGYRNFLVVKKPELGKVEIVGNIKQIVDEAKPTLNPTVGKDDLVQPIVHIGERKLNIEPTYVFGVDTSVKSKSIIKLALFLKNKGKGIITDIDKITFVLPKDFSFDGKEQCGADFETLKDLKKRLRTLRTGQTTQTPILTCDIIAKGEYTNNPISKSVDVKIMYSYTIAKKAAMEIR